MQCVTLWGATLSFLCSTSSTSIYQHAIECLGTLEMARAILFLTPLPVYRIIVEYVFFHPPNP